MSTIKDIPYFLKSWWHYNCYKYAQSLQEVYKFWVGLSPLPKLNTNICFLFILKERPNNLLLKSVSTRFSLCSVEFHQQTSEVMPSQPIPIISRNMGVLGNIFKTYFILHPTFKVHSTRIYLRFLTWISNYLCINIAAYVLIIMLLKETSTETVIDKS